MAKSAPGCRFDVGKLQCMNSQKYPQITVRLTPNAEKNLKYLARARARSRGQIVREALALYASIRT
jgi:hypothetical protein